MYCQIPIYQIACLGTVIAGGIAGIVLRDSLLFLLTFLILMASFGFFRLWRGNRQLNRKEKR